MFALSRRLRCNRTGHNHVARWLRASRPGGAAGGHALREHQAPGLDQAELPLELQRGDRGHGAEVVVEGGGAHAGRRRQGLDAHGTVEALPDDCDGADDAGSDAVGVDQGADRGAVAARGEHGEVFATINGG